MVRETTGKVILVRYSPLATQVDGTRSVYVSDLDGDGDLDVLSASYLNDKVTWHENDGQGSFGQPQVITAQTAGVESVYAADLDGDGDPDVLSASYRDDKVAWYENLLRADTVVDQSVAGSAGIQGKDISQRLCQ